VLTGAADPGKKTVVIGGGLVGCELALHLIDQGVEVTIVEALPEILMVNRPLCHANSEMLERLVPFKGTKLVTGACAVEYKGGALKVAAQEGQAAPAETEIPADSVILAVGYAPENALYEELRYDEDEIWLLGDARRVANIMYAVWDAFEVANSI